MPKRRREPFSERRCWSYAPSKLVLQKSEYLSPSGELPGPAKEQKWYALLEKNTQEEHSGNEVVLKLIW